jgi:rhodanese-related sulfurtransferase
MKRLDELLEECRREAREVLPWDLVDELERGAGPVLVDVREPEEFAVMRLRGSINVPRGILETSIEWGYDETLPELVEARGQRVVVICRSGIRSLFAARRMRQMGYRDAVSLKTGLRGWVDYEQPLVDGQGREVDIDDADAFLTPHVRPDQMRPRTAGK